MHVRRMLSLLALAVLATACSGGDSGADPRPDPSPASSSRTTPDPTDEPTLAQSPCELLTRQDYARYVPPGLRGRTTLTGGLDILTGTYKQCELTVGGLAVLTWGYSSEPDSWQVALRHTEPRTQETKTGERGLDEAVGAVTDRERTPVQAGDEAFIFQAFLERSGYVRVDDTTIRVSPGPLVSPKATGLDLVASLVTLGSNAASGLDPSPVDLPDTCPQPSSRAVSGLIGEVTHAYGHPGDSGQPLSCHYRSASGTVLQAEGAVLPAATFEREYPATLRSGDRLVEDSPQRWVSLGPGGEPGDLSLLARYPTRSAVLTVRTLVQDWGRQRRAVGARAPMIAFWEAFRAAAEPTLR